MVPTDPKVRRFRASSFATRHVATDQISKFWFRNALWASLLRELMARSLADDPALRVFKYADLALRTGLSIGSIQKAIDLSVHTGDFAKIRLDYDKRYISLQPSTKMHEYFDEDIKNTLHDLSCYCGRDPSDPDYLLKLGGSAYRRLMIRFMSVPQYRQSSEAAILMRRKFFFFMWDLILNMDSEPVANIDVIAKSLNISVGTIREVLRQARAGGWLEPGDELRPSAMALHRYTMLFSVAEMRANLLLDALEMVSARPALAPFLDPQSI